MQNGDRLRSSVEGTESRITSRKVVARKEAGLAAEVMDKLTKAEAWSEWKVSPKCIVVTLDRASELKPGDCVYSPDRMGQGFVFRNNRIHSPGRILLKAGGLMEGNVLDTPHALIACPELPGRGAAGVEDLVIRNNRILNGGWFCAAPWSCQAGIISPTATSGSSELRTASVYKNVRIEGNTVEGGSGPALVVSSTSGLVISNNRFVNAQQDEPPSTGASYRVPKQAVVWVSRSSQVQYEGNAMEGLGAFAAKEPVPMEEEMAAGR